MPRHQGASDAATPASAAFRPGLFAGSRVLVVGGTGGIGLAIARVFAELGAEVAATGAVPAEVEAARETAPELRLAALDVTDDAAVGALVGGFDTLDVLVNCAGIIRRGEEHRPEAFARVIDVNLN
ncbi:MAG TPA: SDR family NAD(P)-dependent oxidoreductase, partial [Geminicoccaceae bacterium]